MSEMRLVVAGAAGRMGRMLVQAIHDTPGAVLAGALGQLAQLVAGQCEHQSPAHAPAVAASGGTDIQSSLMSMLPLLLMFAVLYFVMIRPQMKKQKEHRAMIDALAKGDEVVTAGGLLGKVSKIGDGNIGVEIASGVEVQMQRSAVVQVLPKGSLK